MLNPNRDHPRLLYLDSARGLAALRVLTWHFFVMFFSRNDTYFLKNPLRIFYYGDCDMLFFFIHSGFILSYSYAKKLNWFDPTSYFRFFIERIFRIFPLFLFLLIISFLLYSKFYVHEQHLYFSEHAKKLWSANVSLADVFQQGILFIMPQSQSNKRLLPQDWTLSVEIIVGALLPFLMISIKRSVWLFFIIFFILWRLCNTYVFEFGIGVFLFHYKNDIKGYWSRIKLVYKVALCVMTVLFQTCFFQFPSLFSSENIFYSYSVDRLLVNIGCVLLFIIIISSKKLQNFMSSQWMVWLGKICFSLYLWHVLVLILFSAKVYSFLIQFLKQPYFVLSIVFFIMLSSTILLSFFSYKFIEVPFNKLGKKISIRTKPI